ALDPCPRQRDRRRAQTRCQRALALPVPVTSANRTDPLRPGCAQRRLQFLVDDGLDGRPNPLPHQLLEAPFSSLQTPAIAFHSVILRHPPPSGCELGTTRRIMTLFYFSTNCTTLPQSYSLHPQSSQAPYSYTWVDPYTDPAKDKDAQGKEELQIIHLHGYAGVPTGRDPQLVFSILEYLQAYSARYAWHRVFGDTFYQRPFLVVGARLTDEWDLMEFLSRGTASRESTGRPSLIVLRDISTIQREQLTRYGLVPIQMDATQFFEELRQRVQPREEQLLQLPHGRGRIETPGRIFLQQFQWLRLDAAEIEPRNHDFYDGDDPIWSDILAARDANFEITTRTLAKIRAEISDPHPKQLIYCLSGPPGSGKSTVLLRLAKELITDGVDLYSFRAEERLDIPA